jgi:hypothetical protein
VSKHRLRGAVASDLSGAVEAMPIVSSPRANGSSCEERTLWSLAAIHDEEQHCGKTSFPYRSYAGREGSGAAMAKRLSKDEAHRAIHEETFWGTGRNLRRAYEHTLSAPPDAQTDALIKLLFETSHHEMGSC